LLAARQTYFQGFFVHTTTYQQKKVLESVGVTKPSQAKRYQRLHVLLKNEGALTLLRHEGENGGGTAWLNEPCTEEKFFLLL